MSTKINFVINAHDEGFTLYAQPQIELEVDQFSKIVSIISERLQWKHQGIEFAGMDGLGTDFEKRADGTTLSIENTVWLGLNIESTSREVLEKIKPILEHFFSNMT